MTLGDVSQDVASALVPTVRWRQRSRLIYVLNWATIRLMDWLLALIIGLPALILMAAVLPILNLFCNRGPLFYRDERWGKHQKRFKMLKFRTMRKDAPDGAVRRNDKRVTRLGTWLRKSRLDELPQMFHVLLFQMAVVGPRPAVPRYEHYMEPGFWDNSPRFSVLPGITGIYQTRGREQVSYGDSPEGYQAETRLMVDCDRQFIETATPWLVFKIYLRTAGTMFRREGIA